MFDAMQNFVRVVESGSFSHAGKTLNKNASSVARQIDKLEEELDTRLFNRSTRRIELTLAGEAFYQQCLDILQAVQSARDSLQTDQTEVRGNVSITVLDSYGRRCIAPLLPQFCRQYPHVNVALSLDNSMVDLHNSSFDLAIRYGTPADSNLIMKSLGGETMKLVASPDYLDKHEPILHPSDLKQHNCLTFHRPRQHTYWYFRHGSHSDQQIKIKVNGHLSSCGGEPLADWAANGEGISLLSLWMVEQALAEGRLVEVLQDWRPSVHELNTASVHMVWTATSAQRPAVRSMIDFLDEHLKSR